MALDPTQKYLEQTLPNGSKRIWPYTDEFAKRPDMVLYVPEQEIKEEAAKEEKRSARVEAIMKVIPALRKENFRKDGSPHLGIVQNKTGLFPVVTAEERDEAWAAYQDMRKFEQGEA